MHKFPKPSLHWQIYILLLTICLSFPGMLDCLWFFRVYSANLEAITTIVVRGIYVMFGASIIALTSYCICIAIEKKFNLTSRIIAYVFLFASFMISFADVSMMRVFNRRISAGDIELIKLTTPKESSGFITTYLTDPRVITIFFIILFTIFVFWGLALLLNKYNKLYIVLKHSAIGILVATCLLFLLEVSGFTTDTNKKFPGFVDSYSNIIREYGKYLHLLEEVEQCGLSQLIIKVDGCKFKSDNIIIIIGESFNRHHSSLYGYPLNTNPELGRREDLYVFEDVIAAYNVTMAEFHSFMSMASVDEKRGWYEAPLVLAIMKKAGYKVHFYSNQFPKENYTTSLFGGQFLNHQIVDSLSFDFRNTKNYRYDKEFVDYFFSEYKVNKDRYNLIFLHLQGQHLRPQDQYPTEYEYFHEKDIRRSDLNEKQRQQVAYYDNATRYNDNVVNNIIEQFSKENAIVIYFADHGEEANDFRAHIGRAFDFENGKNVITNQFDIPFIVYLTPKYKESHPNIVSALDKAKPYPFMIDDLPHVILGLAGVQCKWYDSRRDLLNSNFNTKRKRMIGENRDIDYDLVCK